MFHISAISLMRSCSTAKCIIHSAFSSQFPSGSQTTIYALATGGIRCALGVIRVSGPNTRQVLHKVGRFSSERKLPEPRKAVLKKLYDPMSDKVIDHGIVLWFPGPKSFTGEDSCEFHVHGGPAIITTLLRSIGNVPGCRMAEPGEFSKRAFLNGKMDLTEVEGLGDLISAETEMQRAQALNQMSGSLGSLYESWRDRIAKCLANAEAFIDFGEDENIESDILVRVEIEIESLVEEMTNHLKDQRKGERLRNGVRIAILGKPNVGKSSLLNLLCKRDVAIVSSIPGTTRDIVESCIDLRGYPVVFADTAGIRSSPDEIEKEGVM
ncbi:tRNA modification GTPase GTPBP3, mitochondrial [Orchesella cincta]|uniref:tRNA modification GTPase GTPBP3, mitochondrial n=1 Tax=Orchesella cincta TaxID=48709 RepID=A0A1D2NE41_ORCCI|nr:tRNA modification GTPase GTPBP3, mitochondrial [Orchesella cincta]